MKIALILTSALLAGCATKWSHPNGGANFNSDLYQCQQEAASMYPPAMSQVMTSPGYQAPQQTNTTTNCNVNGQWINCQSTQQNAAAIYNRPAQYVTVDNNAGARGGAVRQCLRAKGYQSN